MSSPTDGGTPNATVHNVVPPSTVNAGITTQEQRAAAEGEPTGNNNSINANSQGDTSRPVGSKHRGLREKLEAQVAAALPQDYAREFARQQKLAAAYSTEAAKDFMWEQNMNFFSLRVFAFLEKKSAKLRVGYGIGVCDEGDEETDGYQLLFVGDRDQYNTTPPMYSLPKEKSYKWEDVKADYNVDNYLSFYEAEENKNVFKDRGGRRGTTEKVPTMMYIPYEAALLVVNSENGCTPWELLKGLTRLEEDDTSKIQPEHTALIKKFCIAAMAKGASEKDSKLAIELRPLNSPNNNVARFKREKINHLLDKPPKSPAMQKVAAQASVHAPEKMEELMSAVVNLANKVHATNNNSESTTPPQEMRQQDSALQGAKELKGALGASVMGFTGVTEIHSCMTKIWTILLSSESTMTKRDELLHEMQKWARAHSLEIEVDFLLESQFFKDLLAGDFTVGDPIATEYNIGRGLTPQWFMPVTAQYKRQKEDEEEAEAATESTRTLAEKRELQKVADRPPPENLGEILVLVNTGAAFLFVLFGNGCDLYKKMLGLSTELNSASSKRMKNLLSCVTIHQKVKYVYSKLENSPINLAVHA